MQKDFIFLYFIINQATYFMPHFQQNSIVFSIMIKYFIVSYIFANRTKSTLTYICRIWKYGRYKIQDTEKIHTWYGEE